MYFQRPHTSASRQQGTTLVVVLVLILLATVMALFAVKVNVSEQRSSGSDVKTRLMRQAAEAAMAQGMQYMQSLRSGQLDPFVNTASWTRCTASDKSFPCGAVPVDDGSTLCGGAACKRRANMYYYTGPNAGSLDAIQGRELPLTDRLTELTTTGNGFTVNYGVGAVLCDLQNPSSATDTSVQCATDASNSSGVIAYTLVALGSIPGEAAHATLTQTVGKYLLLNNAPGAPPIVASGSVDVVGNFQIVTNPNSGGPGVPVSIWTRGAVDKHGTSNTCYYDEFIRDGVKGSATVTLEPALDNSADPPVTAADQILRCDKCYCTADDSLSFGNSGNRTQLSIDILQCSTGPTTPCDGTAQADANANFDLKPNEFPCDLFQYVFKTAGHKDTNSDNFCEKQITVQYKAADGVTYTMGADEAYLYAHATKINATAGNASKLTPKQTGWSGCGSLGTSDYGIYWDQSGSCTVSGTVGSIVFPLLLVADTQTWIKGTMFGFSFTRATGSADLDPTTGGNANFKMNAGAALYGAAVVQGTVTKVNGNAAIIYSDKVLKNLTNNSIPPQWGTVPGSWSDRFSY